MGADDLCVNFKLSVAGNGVKEADVEIAGDGFNVAMEETMGHGGVEERGDNAAVQYTGVSLQQGVTAKGGMDAAIVCFAEF